MRLPDSFEDAVNFGEESHPGRRGLDRHLSIANFSAKFALKLLERSAALNQDFKIRNLHYFFANGVSVNSDSQFFYSHLVPDISFVILLFNDRHIQLLGHNLSAIQAGQKLKYLGSVGLGLEEVYYF